ncbi:MULTISPECIES: tRNA (guanosine(46)-N7)-methyltransferase TrmB [Bacillus]|uniref:tRNA (guanosine(46)-N7)-methyltransferase TrmB n=1 Tax=Bacillus TaxID=1386 RepID=UPI000BB85514|nr:MULTISPECIES: tRNA (guanosine(46)-N7)-methyltransferase TrmB [Bacillus]
MRIRNKPWAKDLIEGNPHIIIQSPEEHKGKWHEVFGNNNPIHIEVGTGKGNFVTGMAAANPNINYIGIELYESVIVVALQKVIDSKLPNVKLLNVDAVNLPEIFASSEVGQVYLNFSDPWPKKRHEKRRLTHSDFLDLYKKVLVDKGEIHFKTDNRGLFEYSLISFNEYGLQLKYVSLDLHNSDYEGNVMTEYEQKFSELGQPIYRCEVKYK